MINNNNGMFEKIKKTMATSHQSDFIGRASSVVQNELKQTIEQEFAQRFANEKERFAQQLENKFKRASQEYINEQEHKFQQCFAEEKNKYQKQVKEKYEQLAKQLLRQHEKGLLDKHNKEIQQLKDQAELQITKLQQQLELQDSQQQMQVAKLEQEMQQKQYMMQVQLEESKIATRKEQEQLSRKLYEDLLQANKLDILQQVETKSQQELAYHEGRVKLEYNEKVGKLKDQLLAEYQEKLQQSLLDQQQKLQQEFSANYTQQEENFKQHLAAEVATAVRQAADKLQAEFAKERQELNAIIESMKPELELNKQRLRAEAEAEVNVEFELRLNQYKVEFDKNGLAQIQEQLTVEKQRLAEELQQQNLIVIKYKERELREIFEAEKIQVKHQLEDAQRREIELLKDQQRQELIDFQLRLQQEAQQVQSKLTIEMQNAQANHAAQLQVEQLKNVDLLQNMQLQYSAELQSLSASHAAAIQNMQEIHVTERQTALHELESRLQQSAVDKLNNECAVLMARHEERLRESIITERARLLQETTNEKKILLQQQEANLQQQFSLELTAKLAEQAQRLASTNQNSFEMNQKLQQRELELRQQFSLEKAQLEHQFAVQYAAQNSAQEAKIRTELEQQFALQKAFEIEQQVEKLRFEYEQKIVAQTYTPADKFAQTLQATQAEWQQKQLIAIEQATAEARVKCERELRQEFQALLDQQRKVATEHFEKQKDHLLHNAARHLKLKVLQEVESENQEQLAVAREQIKQEYAFEFQQHLDAALEQQREELVKEYTAKFAHLQNEFERKAGEEIEQERKKINVKFAQDKATLIQEVTAKFAHEKKNSMSKYETELRDSLYKEMVKQKEYVQLKFTASQKSALEEQRRRLDAQHKQEIERIKQGFFDPKHPQDLSNTILGARYKNVQVERRGVEQLADQILAKFNK